MPVIKPNLQKLFSEPIGRGVKVNLDLCARRYFLVHGSTPNRLLEANYCHSWLGNIEREEHADYTWGGYLEDRRHIWQGSYLKPDGSIHLGIDINVRRPIGVICPVPFTVIDIFDDSDTDLGWGRRVTVATDRGIVVFGHLKPGSDRLIGYLGEPKENGNCFMHLHLQGLRDASLLKNLDGYGPDLPSNSIDYPNPLRILGLI